MSELKSIPSEKGKTWSAVHMGLNKEGLTNDGVNSRLTALFMNLIKDKMTPENDQAPTALKVLDKWIPNPTQKKKLVNFETARKTLNKSGWEPLLYRTFGAQALFTKDYPPQARVTVTLEFGDNKPINLLFWGIGKPSYGGVEQQKIELLFHVVSGAKLRIMPGDLATIIAQLKPTDDDDGYLNLQKFSLEVNALDVEGSQARDDTVIPVGFDENVGFLLRKNEAWYRQISGKDEILYKVKVPDNRQTYKTALAVQDIGLVPGDESKLEFDTERYESLETKIDELFTTTGMDVPQNVASYEEHPTQDISKFFVATARVPGDSDIKEEGKKAETAPKSPRGSALFNAEFQKLKENANSIVDNVYETLYPTYRNAARQDYGEQGVKKFADIAVQDKSSWKKIALGILDKPENVRDKVAVDQLSGSEETQETLSKVFRELAKDTLREEMRQAINQIQEDLEFKQRTEDNDMRNKIAMIKKRIVVEHNGVVSEYESNPKGTEMKLGPADWSSIMMDEPRVSKFPKEYTEIINQYAEDENYDPTTALPDDAKNIILEYIEARIDELIQKKVEEEKRRAEEARRRAEELQRQRDLQKTRIDEFAGARNNLAIDSDKLNGAKLVFNARDPAIPVLVFQDPTSGRSTRVTFSEMHYETDDARYDVFDLNYNLAGPFPIRVSDQPGASRRGIYLARGPYSVFLEVSGQIYHLTAGGELFDTGKDGAKIYDPDNAPRVGIWVSNDVSTAASAVITHAVVIRDR